MTIRTASLKGLRAARANLMPGLLLQAVMLCFLSAYLLHDGTRAFFTKVGEVREEVSYAFSIVTYIISGAVLPEALRIVFFQKGRPTLSNLWSIAKTAPLWAGLGILVDFFYRCQNEWFGTGNAWQIIMLKVLVDQFVFSPFLSNPTTNAYLTLCTSGVNTKALKEIFSWDFVTEKILPTQIAGWSVWIPGVCLVYFMPPLLQLPTAVLIQCFWVLLLTSLHERESLG